MKRLLLAMVAWLAAFPAVSGAQPWPAACIQPIAVGQTINQSLTTNDCILGDNFYTDLYTFNGTAGQKIHIELNASGFDAWLELHNVNDITDAPLVFDGDVGSPVARIPSGGGFFTLPTTATYYIYASSVGDHQTGAYMLALTGPSTNAKLASLVLSAGMLSPPFASDTLNYSATVVSLANTIFVTPTLADGTATVKVNDAAATSGAAFGPISLNVGSNPITVVVTAQDGTTTRTYSVNVTYVAAAACPYSVSPLDLSNRPALGGAVSVVVTTPAGCPVAVTPFQPWVTVNSITPSGGTTTVSLQIAPNAGAARATSIRLADRLYLVTQLAP